MPESLLNRLDRVRFKEYYVKLPRNEDCKNKEGQVMLLPGEDPTMPQHCVVSFPDGAHHCMPEILEVIQPACRVSERSNPMSHGPYAAGDHVQFRQPLGPYYEAVFAEYEMEPDSLWTVVIPRGSAGDDAIFVLPNDHLKYCDGDTDFRERAVELSEDLVAPVKRPN